MKSASDDGVIRNCTVQSADSSVMGSESAGKLTPMSMAFFIYVEDTDASIQRALENGDALLVEVEDQPNGDARDSHGNYWWISQRTVEASYEAQTVSSRALTTARWSLALSVGLFLRTPKRFAGQESDRVRAFSAFGELFWEAVFRENYGPPFAEEIEPRHGSVLV